MEENNLKETIQEMLETSKSKNITLEEIYQFTKTIYSPEIAKQMDTIIEKLVQENKLEPLKNAKKNLIGTPLKYRIVKPKKDYIEVKQEIMKLHNKINIQYYLKHPEEYEEDRDEILKINNFITLENKEPILTVNERSYQIWKDEKKLKQQENILKKLGIDFKELNCYETYEPFFYFENNQYNEKNKKVLIIENRDTFWTFKKIAEKYQNFYLIIYGEGKKILNSFEYIENFNIKKETDILYFGDIDYEGINIYVSLVQTYSDYHILPYVVAYHKMIELENNPNQIKKKQNKREDYIEVFLNYFDEEDRKKLRIMFENNFYIPQEILNYEEVEKIV